TTSESQRPSSSSVLSHFKSIILIRRINTLVAFTTVLENCLKARRRTKHYSATVRSFRMKILWARAGLRRYIWLLAALPLASGAALVVHILSHISLGLALLVASVIVVSIGGFAWTRLTPTARITAAQRMQIGLM